MNKKGADDGATIAALTGAIEQLAQRSKNREQLQGIIATAKDLAQHWESKKRPLFEGYDNPLIQLLAALVVALRHYYDLLEPILRSSRDEFEKLRYANQETELSELANQLKNADDAKLTPETRALRDVLWPQLTTKQRKQRSEWKRRKCHRGDKGEIEWQFGNVFPILLSYVYGGPVIAAPTCLDGIFAGNEVSMATLEKVFGMDRHQLLENHRKRFNTELPGNGKGRARRYSWPAVVEIMHALLSEKLPKRKKSAPGRPHRMPWLINAEDPTLRTRVLQRIVERANSVGAPEKIRRAFTDLVE